MHPDAALLALRATYERTLADLQAAAKKHSPFEEAYFAWKRADPSADDNEVAMETGYDVAEAEYTAVVDANTDVIDQIAATPALTFDGIMFKAEIAHREDMNPNVTAAVIYDLVALMKG